MPFADSDAGLYQVSSAMRPDGGSLPAGWWLSPVRMAKLGTALVNYQNDTVDLKRQVTELSQTDPFLERVRVFMIGVGVGTAVGVAITIMIAYLVK